MYKLVILEIKIEINIVKTLSNNKNSSLINTSKNK